MSKIAMIAAEVIAGVALVATGAGAILMPGFGTVVSLAGISTTAMFAASASRSVRAALVAR